MKLQFTMKPAFTLARILAAIGLASALLSSGSSRADDKAAAQKSLAELNITRAQLEQLKNASSTDLEVVNGSLLWNGPKRKDNTTNLDATLNNIIELLREQHPDANFIMAPGLANVDISDFKLRNASAREALQAWITVRAQIAAPQEKALFVGARGRRIAPGVVERQLRAWGARQGVQGKLHPHMLRHSFASHVLQSSQDLRAVQEMLGHASISTTQVYTHLDFQALAKVYDAAHPRAKKK